MRTRFVLDTHTCISDRLHTIAIDDRKEHRPQTIRSSIDRFLIAEFVEVIGLARLEKGNVRIAGAVQGDVMTIGDMA
jgi:hypothetical protein